MLTNTPHVTAIRPRIFLTPNVYVCAEGEGEHTLVPPVGAHIPPHPYVEHHVVTWS